MKSIFIIVNRGEAHHEAFTSLKMACEHFGLSYSAATKGKRVFVNNKNQVTTITEARIIRIKGRDENYIKKKPQE
jgi:hypothetical protein